MTRSTSVVSIVAAFAPRRQTDPDGISPSVTFRPRACGCPYSIVMRPPGWPPRRSETVVVARPLGSAMAPPVWAAAVEARAARSAAVRVRLRAGIAGGVGGWLERWGWRSPVRPRLHLDVRARVRGLQVRVGPVAPEPGVRFDTTLRRAAHADHDLRVEAVAPEQRREHDRAAQAGAAPDPRHLVEHVVHAVGDVLRRLAGGAGAAWEAADRAHHPRAGEQLERERQQQRGRDDLRLVPPGRPPSRDHETRRAHSTDRRASRR